MPTPTHPDPAASRADLQPASAASVTRVTEETLILKEKVASLEAWRRGTEADLKDIREIISQVKLLMSLSIGGGGLSIISLIVTIAALASLLR
jgi:hypothetical protein